jgi:peptide deformylase
MSIVTVPDTRLNQKVQQIQKIDQELLNLIEQMKADLRVSEIGVGIAAPQVGVNIALFITSPNMPNVKNKKAEPIRVFINPVEVKNVNISRSAAQPKTDNRKPKTNLEGCLSIPDVWGHVTRNQTITISFQDERGKRQTETFKGFMAVIIQHEMDHLNGILFTQRVLEQEEMLYRYNPKTDKYVEIEV